MTRFSKCASLPWTWAGAEQDSISASLDYFLRLTNNWRALEKVTADEWMLKWAGKTVYEQMWKPLLIGKFGPFYKDVNMAWMWARIKARTTRLGTFEGGFQKFADLFAEKLRDAGSGDSAGNTGQVH